MDDPDQVTEFGKILMIGIVGVLLVLLTLFIGKVISPKKPTAEKLSTYECGEEPIGNAWVQINPRFYTVGLIFLLFDVELIFIFPWATVFGQSELIAADSRWGVFTLIEMGLFVGILLVGLLYVWKKGDLEWVKPHPHRPTVPVTIPAAAYESLNRQTYTPRPFAMAEPSAKAKTTAAAPPTAVRKPAFRPTFKKPDTPS